MPILSVFNSLRGGAVCWIVPACADETRPQAPKTAVAAAAPCRKLRRELLFIRYSMLVLLSRCCRNSVVSCKGWECVLEAASKRRPRSQIPRPLI